MIVWINGAYGSGKSTAAHTLADRIPGAQHFSAEHVGDAVRENLKNLCYHAEYPNYAIWRKFVAELLLELGRLTDKPVFVPMTVLKAEYIWEISDFLKENGQGFLHIILDTDAKTTLERIVKRGEEEDSWCGMQSRRCEELLKAMPGIHIDGQRSPEEVVEAIRALLSNGENQVLREIEYE